MTRRVGWLLPGAAVLGGVWALEVYAAAPLLDEVARGYPWLAYGGAFLLAILFHRSRVAVTAGLLALAHVLVVPGVPEIRTSLVACAAALLVGGLSLARDRGLFSPMGLIQAGVVGGVVAVAAFVWWEAPQDVTRILAASPLPAAALAWTGLPQIPALCYGVGALGVSASAIRWGGPVERGLLWVLPASLLAAHGGGGTTTTLHLMGAAVILILSVLEASYAMAYRDDLTELPARRALMRDLEALGGTYTLAMVDVDHFKKFNDRHGHDVGDQVLKMVAGRLGRAPGGGRAYRYGGEEFTLVYPGRSRDEALPHLEAVRESVASARFSLRSWTRPRKKPAGGTKTRGGKAPGGRKPSGKERTLSVTVSLGMADSSAAGSTPDAVLKKADQALYRAKKAGRNRVAK